LIETKTEFVDYQVDPGRYKHWRVSFDGPVATVTMDVSEDGGLRPGYRLKLNSYDLGVDIEFHDVLQRIRFEHPEVRSVVITSAKNRVFCSGANIYMLGQSSHAWKVNFCKFTNETRNGIEDSSRYSGLKFLAACNGTTAGGGYELALACDEIMLVDDRSSTVSLPEVPLLGVLPGTGGLTRVTDKRKVRRDHADIFCTTPDGVRGQRAKDWRLVDAVVRTQDFGEAVKKRAGELAEQSDRPIAVQGVTLTPLERTIDSGGLHYRYVDVEFNRAARTATISVRGPDGAESGGSEPPPRSRATASLAEAEGEGGRTRPTLSIEQAVAAGAGWWPLQMARELDDAILSLRTNELELGLWLFKATGDPEAVVAMDRFILDHQNHWFVREVLGMMRRTFARLDVSSRSMFTFITPGSCFAGTLLELAFASDRVYMLQTDEGEPAPSLMLSPMNFGALPMVNDLSRLAARFHDDRAAIDALRAQTGVALQPLDAMRLGLVTDAPDALDWDDEMRQAIESRVALSPDALTGMEANLRFGLPENQATRVFGRLSAWQNWIFIRPNATGQNGALKVYGSGAQPKFDWERV
jgi:benzoyl-CoA-dihydrodiol lyase